MSPERQTTAADRTSSHSGRAGFGLQLLVEPSALANLLDQLRQIAKEAVAEAALPRGNAQPSPHVEPAKSESHRPVGGVELPDGSKLKATDLRTALLLGKLPESAGLLCDTETTAGLLNVSSRTLHRLLALKAVPEPVRIAGKIRRWRVGELLEWLDAGCPPQSRWNYDGGHKAGPTKRR